jgi:hypothetical protein
MACRHTKSGLAKKRLNFRSYRQRCSKCQLAALIRAPAQWILLLNELSVPHLLQAHPSHTQSECHICCQAKPYACLPDHEVLDAQRQPPRAAA